MAFISKRKNRKKTVYKINSNQIKSALLSYYRYKRQSIVGTEVNLGSNGSADILAENKGYITEVEVKTSISDLKKDFTKRWKHKNYKDTQPTYTKYYPHYFYFCLPDKLIDQALEYLEDKNKKYGIMSYDANSYSFTRPEEYIRVVRSAKKLHDNSNEILKEHIVRRVVSELCTIYEDKYGQPEYYHEDQLFFEFDEKKID